MSAVEDHIARLQAMKPKEGGWMTTEFQLAAVNFCAAHMDDIEAAWEATQQATGEGPDPLGEHFRAMQRMATAYLMPEDYRDRDGRVTLHGDDNNTDFWKAAQAGHRAIAFAGDMIYMLDGPEERAALSAWGGALADLRKQIKLAIVANVSIGEGRFFGIESATDSILKALATQQAVTGREVMEPMVCWAWMPRDVLGDWPSEGSLAPARPHRNAADGGSSNEEVG